MVHPASRTRTALFSSRRAQLRFPSKNVTVRDANRSVAERRVRNRTLEADAQCTNGRNGRCVDIPPGGCTCSYDGCASDADCGANQACACRETVGGASRCVPANCHVDADCGSGAFCSPTLDSTCGPITGVVGWFCHTAADTCSNDADRANVPSVGPPNEGTPYCAFFRELGHWACSTTRCIP